MKKFAELDERSILALAISNEEEDGRTYADLAHGLRENFPATAGVFDAMADEENGHRKALIDMFVSRFGDHIPQVRRQDIGGAPRYRPAWQLLPSGIEAVRRQASRMEADASRFYTEAAKRTNDAAVRRLLGDLAAAEASHGESVDRIEQTHLTSDRVEREDEDSRRRFVLQVVQPGLVGLMDGSVSTLAPVFAAAFATHLPWNAFLVGLAATVGAGISMGFAEALADDGKLSGRGTPVLRGLVCGLMTMAGGIGHTLPYLIPHFWTATALAAVVVVIELAVIAYIQYRFMDTPVISAISKVMLGGALVLTAGILIGNA